MTHLDDLNQKYPIRRSPGDKIDFRRHLTSTIDKNGKISKIETSRNGKNKNVIVGDPEKAKVVFTAHYDTPAKSVIPNLMMPKNVILLYLFHFIPIFAILAIALTPAVLISNATGIDALYYVIFLPVYIGLLYLTNFAFTNKNNYNDNTSGVATLLEIIDRLPQEKLSLCAFIFFDNEEKGLLGSKAYFKDHKSFMKDKLVINFDCVGNGDNILFVAKKLAESKPEYASLKECFKDNENYRISYHSTKNTAGNSDHKSFPNGVCCLATSRGKLGILYTARIHTSKDTKVKNENVEFLTEGALAYIDKL